MDFNQLFQDSDAILAGRNTGIIKAQTDAPNYRAASSVRRCDNCRFFKRDSHCERFHFEADVDYVCDDWQEVVEGMEDEIPGYQTERSLSDTLRAVMVLRGGPTSGNWGHAGIPKRRGGSKPGGGHKRVGVKGGKGLTREKVKAASEKTRKQKEAKSDKSKGGKTGGGAKKRSSSSLPQDLTKLSARQEQNIINGMAKKPLGELRRLQTLNNKQIKQAFDQQNTPALNNLRVKDRILTQAIDQKEFGGGPKRGRTKPQGKTTNQVFSKLPKNLTQLRGKQSRGIINELASLSTDMLTSAITAAKRQFDSAVVSGNQKAIQEAWVKDGLLKKAMEQRKRNLEKQRG